jgi:hypothetical protein
MIARGHASEGVTKMTDIRKETDSLGEVDVDGLSILLWG